MTALGVLCIGAGAYLCWYAVANRSTVHPVTHARSQLQKVGTPGG